MPLALRRLATALLPLALLLSVLPATAAAIVDDYAQYDGQTTCAREVLPGTDFLLRYLVRTHRGTRSVSTLRACAGDSRSEHKDGRALDWGVDADVPAEKATADRWIASVLASDARGNAHALARRMGIMYLIWDDHIYSAYDGFAERDYRPCERLRDCSKTLRHRDHVHISLSRSGAAAQTSFYRSRRVPSVPVLYPRTNRLDPESTAVVTLDVPATGRTVSTGFKLTRGVTYRVVADGLVRTGAGSKIADAACRWSRAGWVPDGMLRLNGSNPWGSCTADHTYVATYTPATTDLLRLRVREDTPGDASGSVRFAILREDLPVRTVATRRPVASPEPKPARQAGLRGRPLLTEQVTVPAASARGPLTTRSLSRRRTYRVVVTGRAASGATPFDAGCAKYAGGIRAQHTLDLTTPTADHLGVYVQGVRLALRAPGTGRACDWRSHRYVGTFRPVVNGRARVKVWDPFSRADNSGALTVSIRRR